MSAPATAQRRAWLTVDLGGTRLRALAVLPAAGWLGGEVVARVDHDTPRGLPELLATLHSALDELQGLARQTGVSLVPALCLGSPGRFEQQPDGRRTLAPFSTTNLEAHPGELHDLDLVAELSRSLHIEEGRLFVDNDAVVQGLYMIQTLLEGERCPLLLGEPVVCINPGTGLGGCVAEVSADAELQVFTDGHVSEISLHPCEVEGLLGEGMGRIRTLEDGAGLRVELDLSSRSVAQTLETPAGKQAEDCIAGVGLARLARGFEQAFGAAGMGALLGQGGAALGLPPGLDGRLLSALLAEPERPGVDARAVQTAELIADFAGQALLQLTRRLHSGQATKTRRFPSWSEADLQRLHGVRRFVIGGGIAPHPLGQRIVAVARQGWQEQGAEVSFLLPPRAEDAGALGALLLVPVARRAELESLAR